MNRNRRHPSLKHWRDYERLSQKDAASRLGLTQDQYSRMENRKRYPRPPRAKAISERTGVPVEIVLGIA